MLNDIKLKKKIENYVAVAFRLYTYTIVIFNKRK